jgi:hypothetical protein
VAATLIRDAVRCEYTTVRHCDLDRRFHQRYMSNEHFLWAGPLSSFRGKRRFCGLFLFLFLIGCSGTSEILEGSNDGPDTDDVTGALQRVVLPAVEQLAAFSPVNQPAPPRVAAPDSLDSVCVRFDPLCRSGRYEVCPADSLGAVVFRYESCARSVGLLDGSWELRPDGLSAEAWFDLDLDDLALSGRIDYVLDDMCWRKEFVSFNATRRGYSANLGGSIDYCFASGVGSGQLQVSVTGPAESFEMLLEFDAGCGKAVVVRDGVTTVCRFDTADGSAECGVD